MLLHLAMQPSLFGLAPGGVYLAAPVARGAVRSCRTVSPLPAGRLAAPCAGGVFSVALSLGSPPPEVIRHRIPVEPGLSSTARAAAAVQPSGRGRDAADHAASSSGRRQQCGGSVECRQLDRQFDAGKGQRAIWSDEFRLLRPRPIGIATQQFRFNARTVDHEQFPHAWDGCAGPDIGAGVGFVAGERTSTSSTGSDTIRSCDGLAQVTPRSGIR
jgi:hypothetical protein